MNAEVEILDYTHSQLVVLKSGTAKIQSGNLKLIHIFQMEQYHQFLSGTLSMVQKNIPPSNPFYPLLTHELNQIENYINQISVHKTKRSLNFIGSAWKWIAGNPDHDDFELASTKINQVIENNNKQVLINEQHNERINNITKVTNEIINMIKKDSLFEQTLILSTQYKIKIIKEELLHIIQSIQLAKSNIVNSNILSKNELSTILNNFKKNHIPYASVEEALEFINVKVAHNSSHLFYIMDVPLTYETNYEKLIVKPVKRNNLVKKILFSHILRSKEKFFGIAKHCTNFNELSICKSKEVLDISNTTCTPALLKNRPANCKKINSHHIPTVEEITPGIILLNNFNGTIDTNGTEQHLQGTFLLKFQNTSIQINNQKFISYEAKTIQILPPLFQSNSNNEEIEEVLSLQMMRELHLNNTQKISKMESEKTLTDLISYSTYAIIIAILIIWKLLNIRKGKDKVALTINPSPENNHRQVQPSEDNYNHEQEWPSENNHRTSIENERRLIKGKHPHGSLYQIPLF